MSDTKDRFYNSTRDFEFQVFFAMFTHYNYAPIISNNFFGVIALTLEY